MTVQIAMAMMLLVGAGLLVRSFDRLRQVNPGVDPRGVVTAWVNMPSRAYPDDDRLRDALFEMLRRVRNVPGVTSAAITSALPLGANVQQKITFEGHRRPKGQEPLLNIMYVSPDYFRTVGMRLTDGRGIQPADVAGSPSVVVISEVIARRYFPGENPVGKRLIHGSVDSKEEPWTVVGVVNDINESTLSEPPIGVIYRSFHQMPMDWAVFAVRSPLPAQQVLSIIRREVASFDSTLPIGNEGTLESVIYGSLSRERFMMFMLGVFAGVALLLAAVGVYGIIAYIVEQRSHEIGIRMALGALPRDVVALVGGRVLGITALGVAIGVLGSIVGSKAMTKLIFDIAAIDSITYVASALTLTLAAGIAAFIPTLRATRVDPVRAIRAQ